MAADLERALGYPYARPSGAFTVDARDGGWEPLDLGALDLAGRTAVLAIGSNAAPSQLRRKWQGHADLDPFVPVVPVELVDHDVVYAATIAHYGSVPATVIESPGTRAAVHVTLLRADQLAHMDTTEGVHVGAYARVEVDDGRVRAPIALPPPLVAYVSGAGALAIDGSPVALAEIGATGRRFPELAQREILTRVATRERVSLDQLLESVLADRAYRRAVARRLGAGGV